MTLKKKFTQEIFSDGTNFNEELGMFSLLSEIKPLDSQAMSEARERQDELLKPAGSLGTLEEISIQIAGITGQVKNKISKKIHFLFGSDHGIFDEGVSASPQYFTEILMKVYADGGGAINVLCENAGVELKIFDLGVKNLSYYENIDSSHKFMHEGTKNFLHERSMSLETTEKVINFGIDLVREYKNKNFNIIGAGEVGMANTTPAAACIMAALGNFNENLIGRGAGLTDEALNNKKKVIISALNFHELNKKNNDALEILSCVGGLDIAAMTGIFLGGALYRVPVVVDGVISIAAALLASKIAPLSRDFMIASHKSLEPAYSAAAEELNLIPFLNLNMRLGEGSGCPLAMQIIENSLAIINNMKTFNEINLESEYRKEIKN